MDSEAEVVKLDAANTLVPNLTICVEKEDDEKDVAEEMDDDDDGDQKKTSEMKESLEESKAEVKPKLDQFPRKKLYENKKLAGLGLSFEEAKKKREERAKRFASPLVREEQNHEEDVEKYKQAAEQALQRVKAFNSSLTEEEKEQKAIRENALHLQGVDNMSTDEIFTYFGKMDPTHIEWINDTSCNVIWNDDKSASVTLQMVVEQTKKEEKSVKEDAKPAEMDDQLDLEMDIDQSSVEEKPVVEEKATENPPPDVPVNPLLDCKEPFVKNGQKQYLKIRFATGTDRKTLGAAKRSKYYVEYGNPHYGGAKGLFSGSYRKRYQMRNAMKELEGMKVGSWYTRGQQRDDDNQNTKEKADTTKSEIEEDDEKLMKSSAKDLDGAIPVRSNDSSNDDDDDDDSDDTRYGKMVADKVDRQLKSARSMSSKRRSNPTVTTSNDVRSRLGKRRHDNNYHNRPSSRDHDVLERLPNDLRNRLGRKNPSSDSRRQRDTNSSSSARRKSPHRSEAKKSRYSSPMYREMPRYSPPPWE